MQESKSTEGTTDNVDFQNARQLPPGGADATTVGEPGLGRVVSTSRVKGPVAVRITTRPAIIRRSTG